MGDIFLKILNMSISASWLILAVVIIRLIFRKAPKWSMCLLWGLVAVKLVVPFSPESVLSFIPSNEVIPESIATETHPHINSGITYIDMTINPVMESNFSPQIGDSVNPLQVIIYIAEIVWCVGIIICLAYALVSYIILKRKVRASKLLRKGIYACDEVKSPFILGLFRPVIYIPSGMKDEVMEYVIAHENAHLKRGDHFWKPLGFIILSVYWFNPLCWVAYNLLCRDIEYACDEKVICDKDREYVNLYSQALLDCNAQRRIIAACPLAFGETDVKGRIKGILNYKKPAFWVIIASLIICIVVAICFMTKQKQEEPGRIPPELIVRIEGSNEGVSATVRSYTWAEDSIGNDEVKPLEDLHPEMDHSVTDLKFDVENVRLVLEFAEEPDEVLVKCWDEKYVDEGSDLGEGFTEISYNAETHTIDIPGFRSLYYNVRASWENRGGASYAFLINRGDTAGLNEENTELYVSMQVIDDEHADFLFEASDGSLSEAEYLENIWLYFSGDYSRYVLEMLTDPKDGQENAFMYDSLENVAVGKITIDKMEDGIILHADMSAAESWEGVSFSNLKSYELRYRMSTGEEYSRLIDLSESSNPEGFNDADGKTDSSEISDSVASGIIPVYIPSDETLEKVQISSDEPYEGMIISIGDFNEDGITEKIAVDYRDILAEGIAVPGRIALYDTDGSILWSDTFGLPYAGWCRFYIAEIDNIPCLIRYFPPVARQGSWECYLQVYTMNSDNEFIASEQFFCDGTKESAEECKAIAEQYLEHAVMLVSTMDSELKVYK